jgi:hypothetical protein
VNISRAAALAAVFVAVRALGAQAQPTALQRLAVLDAKKIEAVERGDALAITIESPEKTEIATLGVVRLEVPRAFYLDHVRQLTGFLAGPASGSSGVFDDPVKPENLAALMLDPSDAKALEKCQPLSCDVKLPASEMEKFRTELAKSKNPAPRADSLVREWLSAYVAAYRADSTEETVVYDDTKRPVRSSEAFRALLAEPMPAGIDAEPFGLMLSAPRGARPPAVSSRISWELTRMPGLKPVLEVVERSMYSSPTRTDECWMTSKLLYASHYFESQVDFITASDAPAPAGKGAMYLVILRRSKFDDLPSGGLFNIKGKAVKKLRDALRMTLANTRAQLSSAYAEHAPTAAPAP